MQIFLVETNLPANTEPALSIPYSIGWNKESLERHGTRPDESAILDCVADAKPYQPLVLVLNGLPPEPGLSADALQQLRDRGVVTVLLDHAPRRELPTFQLLADPSAGPRDLNGLADVSIPAFAAFVVPGGKVAAAAFDEAKIGPRTYLTWAQRDFTWAMRLAVAEQVRGAAANASARAHLLKLIRTLTAAGDDGARLKEVLDGESLLPGVQIVDAFADLVLLACAELEAVKVGRYIADFLLRALKLDKTSICPARHWIPSDGVAYLAVAATWLEQHGHLKMWSHKNEFRKTSLPPFLGASSKTTRRPTWDEVVDEGREVFHHVYALLRARKNPEMNRILEKYKDIVDSAHPTPNEGVSALHWVQQNDLRHALYEGSPSLPVLSAIHKGLQQIEICKTLPDLERPCGDFPKFEDWVGSLNVDGPMVAGFRTSVGAFAYPLLHELQTERIKPVFENAIKDELGRAALARRPFRYAMGRVNCDPLHCWDEYADRGYGLFVISIDDAGNLYNDLRQDASTMEFVGNAFGALGDEMRDVCRTLVVVRPSPTERGVLLFHGDRNPTDVTADVTLPEVAPDPFSESDAYDKWQLRHVLNPLLEPNRFMLQLIFAAPAYEMLEYESSGD